MSIATHIQAWLQAYTRPQIAIFCLIVIYCVGVAGMATPFADSFILLTPLNLLVSMLLVWWAETQRTKAFYTMLAICYAMGWLVECVGTATGLLFGEYAYGGTLGTKVAGTPLLIGVNWAMLVYAVVALANEYWSAVSVWIKSLLGALVMVGLDVWIEPVAVRYDFWAWGVESSHRLWVAPLQNYLAWFAIAFVLIRVAHGLVPMLRNRVAIALLGLQYVFFIVLYLML